MKNIPTNLVPLMLIGFSFILLSLSVDDENKYKPIVKTENIDIPADIQSIIDNKCTSCHSEESSNYKAKMKMNFDKFTNGKYSNGKLVSKFGKIAKKLNANKMPPTKYLAKNPDKKLTEEETKLILSWADDQRKVLAGE